MKPGFHAAGALWYSLKLLVLASWQGYYSPINPKINPYLCLDMTYPPAKFNVDWSKETQTSVLASWQGFYSPTDPKINPHVLISHTTMGHCHNVGTKKMRISSMHCAYIGEQYHSHWKAGKVLSKPVKLATWVKHIILGAKIFGF